MRFFAALSLVAVVAATPAKRAVDSATYANLLKFYKYSTSAYSSGSCAKPLGNTLVGTFNDDTTDTQGFVVSDATNKQVVVAFRGTSSKQDFITDFDFEPIEYTAAGASPASGALVHRGFLGAYNAVSSQVIALIKKAPATYSIVITGHSLGGGIASIAAGSIIGSFKGRDVTLYTYGQPRTGNQQYASWVNQLLGTKSYRVVHYKDSVPIFVPTKLGFQHHGVEYYQFAEPSNAGNFKACPNTEDSSCSAGNPSVTFLNQDHLSYFNTFFINKFCS